MEDRALHSACLSLALPSSLVEVLPSVDTDNATDTDVSAHHNVDVVRYDATVLYAKSLVDMVTPLLPVSELGRTTIKNGAASSTLVKLSPYSVLTIAVAEGDAGRDAVADVI